MEEIASKFGCVHKTVHGEGRDVIERILNTCEQMLHDRGCLHVSRTANALEVIAEASRPVLSGSTAEGRRIEVYVHGDEKVGVKFARQLVEQSEDADLVIVSLEGPTPFTRKECEGRRVQFLLARDVCFNVTHHHLVPKHEVVPCPPFDLTPDQLPRILDTDPIVQYYNWPVGTVVRVWRCYGGYEPTPYFRLVSPQIS